MPELVATADGGAWSFDLDPITAGAFPVKPPRAWFDNPQLTGPTALTVTADGRVYGHAAAWGVRHIGLSGHVTAPRSRSGYRYYATGQVETDDGAMVNTGRITMGPGHADLSGGITAASEHYDAVCSAVSDVAIGEDAHGIWFAGSLRPDVTAEQVRTLRASSVSGDWRPVGNDLELCGLLAVNVPGFSMPRAALAASGEPTALVAAGAVHPTITITAASTPNEKESPMPEKTEPATTTEPVTAAGPTPPPVDEPGVDTSKEAQQVAEGSPVTLPSDATTGVVTEVDENQLASVLVQVPLADLEVADEKAVAASAAGVRQRVKDAQLESRLSGMESRFVEKIDALTASVQAAETGWNTAEGLRALDQIGFADAEGN